MRTIGITGGLATGKSTVAALFGRLGARVLSADEASRAVLAPGTEAYRRTVEAFGPGIVQADGRIDRRRLGALVFADPEARRALEQITHPPILEYLRTGIDQARAAAVPPPVVAVEAPLLFEAGMEGWFDCVVVVVSSEEAQVARLRARDGMAEDEARRRIAAQMPLAAKARRADHVIRNEGSPEGLAEQVESLWSELAGQGAGPGPTGG